MLRLITSTTRLPILEKYGSATSFADDFNSCKFETSSFYLFNHLPKSKNISYLNLKHMFTFKKWITRNIYYSKNINASKVKETFVTSLSTLIKNVNIKPKEFHQTIS